MFGASLHNSDAFVHNFKINFPNVSHNKHENFLIS